MRIEWIKDKNKYFIQFKSITYPNRVDTEWSQKSYRDVVQRLIFQSGKGEESINLFDAIRSTHISDFPVSSLFHFKSGY